MRTTVTMVLLLTLLTGLVYPAAVTLIGAVACPHAAGGSVLEEGGRKVGSALIGQAFDRPEWFWGRLSATAPVPYTAFDAGARTGSSGSNHGPLHPDLRKAVAARIDALRAAERAVGADATRRVPVDLATASGSGLDPHVSPAAAEYQVERVARARGLAPERVRELVRAHTQPRTLGFLGEPVVNVLTLNLALRATR
jgi:K+-transporting ATPase ATPase C chain